MVDQHYLELLSENFKNIREASTEIVNLRAILSLPKGTEYFLSDLHGENKAFIHMVKSASGVIRSKVEELFGKTLSEDERYKLAALVYDAEGEMERVRKIESVDFDEWCRISIYRLIEVCKSVSSKYTRSKVRKRMFKNSEYILDELLHADDEANKAHYYSEIIKSLLECGVAEEFIIELTETISRLAVDRLHIIGDVYDRGAHPELIMDYLMNFHDVDFQWGNHDIVWMGAAAGNLACIANVIRVNVSYNNFDMLEIGYGINLRPLSMFANEVYKDDGCENFAPHLLERNKYDPVDPALAARMHKAMAVIQFKVEGRLIKNHPEYEMEKRLLLDKIDFEKGSVTVSGKTYKLRDENLPTINPKDPYALTEGEKNLLSTLRASFLQSERLQRHIRFLYSHGAMYKCVNNNLMYHGSLPMTAEGEFEKCSITGRALSGKAYLDDLDRHVRKGYFERGHNDETGGSGDIMWYLWCGKMSPLFGKDQMTTFERCFIADKASHKEQTVSYYKLVNDRSVCEKILREFGLNPEYSHIINGHVPVKIKDGESPIKGDGLLYVIDGGMSKGYQKKTGIAGYTLISNSRFMALAEHKPYKPRNEDGTQDFVHPTLEIVEYMKKRVTVEDTDIGDVLKVQIEELTALVSAFRNGTIKEKF